MRLRVGLLFAAPAIVAAQNPNPMDSIRRLPGYRPAADTTSYLAPARIARLAGESAPQWNAYLARSAARYRADTAAMGEEMRAAHVTTMTRASYAHGFEIGEHMTPSWFQTDSARALGERILSFQAPNGGWSKHVDFSLHSRQPGESYFAESADWEWISTIDNGSTTEEIRFLALLDRAQRGERYQAAIGRGIEYLLQSQMPNGCFPQVYPLEGSYHDAATFNDNATANALTLLRGASKGEIRGVTIDQRRRAGIAVEKGIDCVLRAQLRVGETLTVWGQQHDPLTLEPVSARSYELKSLASLESAGILDFLMSLENPGPRVVTAVHAAAAWLAARPMHGFSYVNYELKNDSHAPPLWGRLYDLEDGRVIMANRDGVKRHDWNELADRRTGYGWYTTKPAATLETYAKWARKHPMKS